MTEAEAPEPAEIPALPPAPADADRSARGQAGRTAMGASGSLENRDQQVCPSGQDVKKLEADIVDALKTCYDPEIPVDIYQLGLIYNVRVSPEGRADIEMTLTSPACPVAGTLPPEVENKVRGVEGVIEARVELVWDPPWNPDMMSEAAKLQLGL